MKKALSILLTVAMVICMIPAFTLGIFADEVTNIASAEDFAKIIEKPDGSYKLTADIKVTKGLSYANEGTPFKGTFDGNGKTITYTQTGNNNERTGLFCSVDGATIKNLNVKADVALTSGGNSASALVGTIKSDATTTISNVNVTGTVKSDKTLAIGGIVGAIEGTGTTVIENCTVNATLTMKGRDDDAGIAGIVGSSRGKDQTIKITGCTVEGTINGDRNQGGFIGQVRNDNTTIKINDSNNKATITGSTTVGGFIGHVRGGGTTTVKIKNSNNKAAVTGNVVGGFIGKVESKAAVTIEGSNNEGKVECPEQYADYRGAAGFIGVAQNPDSVVKFKNCKNKGNVTTKCITASAFIGHNNVNDLTYTEAENSGMVTSGGFILPADMAQAKALGIWSGGDKGSTKYDFEAGTLTAAPQLHSRPELDGAKVYVNGKLMAADKATVAAGDEDRQVAVSVNVKGHGVIDGTACITVVFKDGSYVSVGRQAHSAADEVTVNNSADKLSKYEGVELTYDRVENPLMADNGTPHGTEANLFGGYKDADGKITVTDQNKKYEGHKKTGQTITVYFTAAEAVKVGYYALGTAGDDASFPERQFTEWKFYGSADGKTYVELDHQVDYDMPNINNRLVAFKVDADTAYKFYKVELIKVAAEANKNAGDDSYVQLGEIALFKACEHTWSEPVVVEAQCGKDGSSTKTCTICGEKEVTVINAEAHELSEAVVVDPTCTKKGTSTQTCTKCGEKVVTEIPATGHKYVDGKCTVCGADNPGTGDIAVALSALALVAVAGAVVVAKSKRKIDD